METTRRFLLEWLSFLHRYVPVGILEKPPQRMNERVPEYHGKTFLKLTDRLGGKEALRPTHFS